MTVQVFLQELSLKSTYLKDRRGSTWRDCPRMLLPSVHNLSEQTIIAAGDLQICYVKPEDQANIYFLLAEAIYLDHRYNELQAFAWKQHRNA